MERKCQRHLHELCPCFLWAHDSVDDVLETQSLFNLPRDRIGGLATLLLERGVMIPTPSGPAARARLDWLLRISQNASSPAIILLRLKL